LLVSEILSEFSPDTLTESDAKRIVVIFSEADVEPRKALEEAMKAANFDAKAVGDLAGVGPSKHNSATAGATQQLVQLNSRLTSQMLDFLSEQLDKYNDDELTQENKELIMTVMQEKFGPEKANYLLDV
jgi:hypothetical protein